jgi:hypothetical protein
MEYRHVGTHVEDLDDGSQAAPGDVIELNKDQVREPRAEELIANRVLLPVDDKAEDEAGLAERRQSGRQKRDAKEQQERTAPQTEEEVNK